MNRPYSPWQHSNEDGQLIGLVWKWSEKHAFCILEIIAKCIRMYIFEIDALRFDLFASDKEHESTFDVY